MTTNMLCLITDISLYFSRIWYTITVLSGLPIFLCLNQVFFFTFFSLCSHLKYNISQLIKPFIFMSNYYTYQLLVPLTVKVTGNYSIVSLSSIPVYPKVITKHSPSVVIAISQLKMRPLWNLMNLRSIYYEPGKGRTSNFIFN